MAFKTKNEKYAYKQGIRRGFAEAMGYKGRAAKRTRKRRNKKSPRPGAYNSRGRINENFVDDRNGPVVFWDDNFN